VTTAPRAFAEQYVELVNTAQYDALATLFAPDATFLGPGGREFHGRDEIAAFYGSFLPTINPRVRLATLIEDGNVCVYELEAQIEGQTEYRLGAIDHATLDADGLVARFAVYTK
jgi:uncharacterized protein (TIGR02246 family)